MLLSVEEIQQLTGRKRPTAQIAWLKKHGYRFSVNERNHPVVAVAEATRKLVGGPAARQQEPNWDGLNHG